MSMETDNISKEELRKLLESRTALGGKVQDLLKHDGFLILKAVFENFVRDIKNKDNYLSLEDFRADRKAIEIVQGILEELKGFVNDAELAASQVQQLIDSEDSTPSLLSLEGEGMEEGQSTEY